MDESIENQQSLTRAFLTLLGEAKDLRNKAAFCAYAGSNLWSRLKPGSDRLRGSKSGDIFVEFGQASLWFGQGAGELASYIEVFTNGDYEIGHPLVHPGEAVIDVGANIGLFSISQALKHRDSQIYAFEPNPEAYARLKKNLQANDIGNVTAINRAVYSSCRSVQFLATDLTIVGRLASAETNGRTRVVAVTLDGFCSERAIQSVGLLKIDVEGAEVEVLRGADQTLGKSRQVLVECHSTLLEEQTDAILASRGFVKTACRRLGKGDYCVACYERRAFPSS